MNSLPSGLPEAVADVEDLARFLTSASQFNSRMVKPSAFLPAPKDHETSVYRHGAGPPDALWRLGRETVAGERNIHGVAIVKARHVRAAGLDVVASEPPPRHASVVEWPWNDDPELQKAAQKEKAALVAQHAELLLP